MSSQLRILFCVAATAGSACKSRPAGTHNTPAEPSSSAAEPATSSHSASLSPTISAEHANATLQREGISDTEPSLHIGSPAPAFVVSSWLKGNPVSIVRDKVYVVENWATWCKPCVAAMPHLSSMAETYARRGLVVVAVNVEEDNDAEVQSFVAKNQKIMRYSVAHDTKGYMQTQWIKAAGLSGLPASFVVDRDGRLAWAGHPGALDRVVQAVIAGTWDYAKERRFARSERLAVPYSQRVVELLRTDADRAYALVRALVDTILAHQPEYLSGLAYHILAAPDVSRRDLDVAYIAGARACELAEWTDADAIQTLSKIREQQGKRRDAIALQRRAVSAKPTNSTYAERLAELSAP